MENQKAIPDSAKKVFEGEIFDVYQWEQEMFDGSTKIFERIKRIDTAVILAITEENKIIILNQEQPARGRYISLPSGMIDKGESPLDAAKRELLEETGYEAGQIDLWHSFQMHNKIDWTYYYYIAKNCKKVCDQNLDCGEKIDVKLVEVEEFLEMLLSQKIKGSEIIIKMLKENLLVVDKGKTLENIKNYFK